MTSSRNSIVIGTTNTGFIWVILDLEHVKMFDKLKYGNIYFNCLLIKNAILYSLTDMLSTFEVFFRSGSFVSTQTARLWLYPNCLFSKPGLSIDTLRSDAIIHFDNYVT